MEWRDEVLAEVGRGMGVDGLDFSGSGVVSFEFETRGTLFMELQEEGILMYLVRQISQHERLPVFVKSLRQSHYKNSLRFPLQVGLQGDDQLFFCLFLPDGEFSRPNIESAILFLTEQFDQLF